MPQALPQHTHEDTPRTPPRLTRLKPTRALSIIVSAMLAGSALLGIIVLFAGLIRMAGIGVLGSGAYDADMVAGADVLRVLSALGQLAIFPFLITLYCIWIHGSAVNARRLGAGGLDVSPGWAVGWYFIPFANPAAIAAA